MEDKKLRKAVKRIASLEDKDERAKAWKEFLSSHLEPFLTKQIETEGIEPWYLAQISNLGQDPIMLCKEIIKSILGGSNTNHTKIVPPNQEWISKGINRHAERLASKFAGLEEAQAKLTGERARLEQNLQEIEPNIRAKQEEVNLFCQPLKQEKAILSKDKGIILGIIALLGIADVMLVGILICDNILGIDLSTIIPIEVITGISGLTLGISILLIGILLSHGVISSFKDERTRLIFKLPSIIGSLVGLIVLGISISVLRVSTISGLSDKIISSGSAFSSYILILSATVGIPIIGGWFFYQYSKVRKKIAEINVEIHKISTPYNELLQERVKYQQELSNIERELARREQEYHQFDSMLQAERERLETQDKRWMMILQRVVNQYHNLQQIFQEEYFKYRGGLFKSLRRLIRRLMRGGVKNNV